MEGRAAELIAVHLCLLAARRAAESESVHSTSTCCHPTVTSRLQWAPSTHRHYVCRYDASLVALLLPGKEVARHLQAHAVRDPRQCDPVHPSKECVLSAAAAGGTRVVPALTLTGGQQLTQKETCTLCMMLVHIPVVVINYDKYREVRQVMYISFYESSSPLHHHHHEFGTVLNFHS